MKEVGSDVVVMREHIAALLDLKPGVCVLDAGCGDGHDLRGIGLRVSDDSSLVGLTLSERDVVEAQQATTGDARFEFRVADLSRGIPYQ